MHTDLIFDVGLHVGQDTDFYLKKGFRVVAVEANPLLVQECSQRFAQAIAAGMLTIVNVGITHEAGVMPFYVNETLSEWSSFDLQIGTTRGPYRVIEVSTCPLADLVDRFGVPYYIKLDIEGMDLPGVRSLRRFADKPAFISMENGQIAMIDELFEQGYSRFKFVNQAKIHEVVLPAPTREGRFVDHKFPFGASGPFGDDTAGPWLDRNAVAALSTAYWSNPERDANIHGWFDLHAAR